MSGAVHRMKRAASADVGGSSAHEPGGGRSYAGCKPLTPWCGQEEGAATASTSSRAYVPPKGSRLLFGNENIYVFFRFHRCVCVRGREREKVCVCVSVCATARARQREYCIFVFFCFHMCV